MRGGVKAGTIGEGVLYLLIEAFALIGTIRFIDRRQDFASAETTFNLNVDGQEKSVK